MSAGRVLIIDCTAVLCSSEQWWAERLRADSVGTRHGYCAVYRHNQWCHSCWCAEDYQVATTHTHTQTHTQFTWLLPWFSLSSGS